MMPVGTTPRTISPQILDFCASISPSSVPIYVLIEPHRSAGPSDCFFNVRESVRVNGGTAVFGWTIWERPNVYLEAEHHSVWLPPLAATPVDVTPKENGERGILFLPDPAAEFDGILARPNIRRALVDDPIIYRFLAAGDAKDASRKPVANRGVTVSPRAMMELARAWQDLNARYP